MIRCERFVYGLFSGVGYKLLKTKGIDKILTPQNLERLTLLPSNKQGYTHWLDTEKLIAVSQVEKIKDEYGREGVRNHTVLVTVPDYLTLSDMPQQLEVVFQKESFTPNQVLEPLEIDKFTVSNPKHTDSRH